MLAALLLTAAVSGENLLPNHDFVAGEAGYKLWYRDSSGQPLGKKDRVLRIEGEVLELDIPQAGGLKDGGVFLIEVPAEDLADGATYEFAFEGRSWRREGVPVTVPGTILREAAGGQKPETAFVGPLPPEFRRQSVRFRYDAAKAGESGPQILLFVKNLKGPIQMRRLSLTAVE